MLADEVKLKIRDEFVHGYVNEEGVRVFPTVEALAKRYDLSKSTLYNYSSAESWQRQKNRFQTELQQRVDAERMDRMVSESKKLDDNCIQIAQAMLGTVGRKLQKAIELERLNQDVVGMGSLELGQLSHVTANAQKIGQLALGQAQEISKVSADVSNPEAFQRVMEQLDELADARSQGGSKPLH
jgi:hypothetical protein